MNSEDRVEDEPCELSEMVAERDIDAQKEMEEKSL